MTNKEKFLALVSEEDDRTMVQNTWRIKNRSMLRESQKIALKVLTKLDELGWSQRDLAEKMEVSPQQISKIVSGKENLTIDTQIKLQNILDIPILASYYEHKINNVKEKIMTVENRVAIIIAQTDDIKANYIACKAVKLSGQAPSVEYYSLAQ
ncbi:MAG: helix-turn-helix transcriptional regulator [Saprospiraceae bacterium]|nr:helix-turn-helix transcriptional regulator [Saprospiraceae bacterium]